MNKKTSLQSAVENHVASGMSIALGVNLEQMIPFATGHEIIRQEVQDLTIISPSANMLIDQLIMSGCVRCFRGAGLLSQTETENPQVTLPIPNRTKQTNVKLEPYTPYTLALALGAGATGSSFFPTRSGLGHSMIAQNPNIVPFTDPVSEQDEISVRPLQPDLTILHVQRCDPEGNAQSWGLPGVSREAVDASDRVLVVAEEVVDSEIISSDPNRTIVNGDDVCAVVKEPWGSHPAAVQGYYQCDRNFYERYLEKAESDFEEWAQHWISDVTDRPDYLQALGQGRLAELTIKNPAQSIPVDFGY